jgi:hypothetical protein
MMNKNNLKKLIAEEVKKLLEYEYYVDDEGYAHDDEGNRWYVGSGQKRTYSLRDMPRGHRPRFSGKSKQTKKPMMAFPAGIGNELIDAFREAIKQTTNNKTKSFLSSVLEQYRHKGRLSTKQKETVRRIFKQVGLSAEQIERIDMQG